jgi:hypothetical protein
MAGVGLRGPRTFRALQGRASAGAGHSHCGQLSGRGLARARSMPVAAVRAGSKRLTTGKGGGTSRWRPAGTPHPGFESMRFPLTTRVRFRSLALLRRLSPGASSGALLFAFLGATSPQPSQANTPTLVATRLPRKNESCKPRYQRWSVTSSRSTRARNGGDLAPYPGTTSSRSER